MSKIITLCLIVGAVSLHAQDFYQFKNRWKPEEFIHVEQPQPASGTIQPGWHSAQWTLELVDQYYYKIKNRWRNEYLHIENGGLACGAIQPGWWSAQWILEPIEGTDLYRIRNRWKPEVVIHNQNGMLEASAVQLGWWSAQWAMINVNGSNPVAQTEATTNAPANSIVRRGNNPSAFTPEHNGRIEQAYVRYEDQISINNVSVGDYVYFFPQEAHGEAKGASFDLKNPPICGQTYKVIETNPTLKFDRLMPMMRNTENYYFAFVVEVY
jgi:hypothetical protein